MEKTLSLRPQMPDQPVPRSGRSCSRASHQNDYCGSVKYPSSPLSTMPSPQPQSPTVSPFDQTRSQHAPAWETLCRVSVPVAQDGRRVKNGFVRQQAKEDLAQSTNTNHLLLIFAFSFRENKVISAHFEISIVYFSWLSKILTYPVIKRETASVTHLLFTVAFCQLNVKHREWITWRTWVNFFSS